MKKLKLRFQNFESAEVLSGEQLKKVLGGSGLAKCTVKCGTEEKTRDCGDKQCSTSGTTITCGGNDSKDMCA